MTPLVALAAVALISWLYRVAFSGIVAPERLPAALRDRLDALTPAAFAALVTAHVVGTPSASRAPTLVALGLAAVVARVTGGYALPVLLAVGAVVGFEVLG